MPLTGGSAKHKDVVEEVGVRRRPRAAKRRARPVRAVGGGRDRLRGGGVRGQRPDGPGLMSIVGATGCSPRSCAGRGDRRGGHRERPPTCAPAARCAPPGAAPIRRWRSWRWRRGWPNGSCAATSQHKPHVWVPAPGADAACV